VILPVRPEQISDINLYECMPEYIERINAYIRTNTRFAEGGPWTCIPISDISSFITPTEPELTDKIIDEILPLYEKAGWTVWKDKQPSGSKYITMTSNIWKATP